MFLESPRFLSLRYKTWMCYSRLLRSECVESWCLYLFGLLYLGGREVLTLFFCFPSDLYLLCHLLMPVRHDAS